MRVRSRSIRARTISLVLVPLLSLVGLYAFATTITARDAIMLAKATSVRYALLDPIGRFTGEVQIERLYAAVYLANPKPPALAALLAQEVKTDRYLAVVRAETNSPTALRDSSPQLTDAVKNLVRDTAGLASLRQRIKTHAISPDAAESAYGAIVSAGYSALDQSILENPNVQLVTQALAVMRATKGLEYLLQEQALFTGDILSHSFPAQDHLQFATLVGEHRALIAEGMASMTPLYRSYYQRDVPASAAAALARLENAVINTPAGRLPGVPLLAYEAAAGAIGRGMAAAGFTSGRTLATTSSQVARPIDLRLIIAGGLGLLAILLSVIISIWNGRGLVRQLADLRDAATELATVRLPRVVARLSAGEDVDADAEALSLPPGRDEIGQVREAFNAVQRTAIEAAVGQARLRVGISSVFRNLARRSQLLLHRQLTLLDVLERQATEPEELEPLFQIDHLTTRMRRHAEGLVVLAGDQPGRAWTEPVLLVDVLRGAVAEVADYGRIRVITKSRAALAGAAVADVIHVIAELAENATLFSPPNTPVRILGDTVGSGFGVEIEDRGRGMTEEKMARLNATLASPPQLDVPDSERLGLYVAARLAVRHGLRITLRSSPFGGTTAIVLIPQDLVVPEGRHAGHAAAVAGKLTGRHASRVVAAEPDSPAVPASHNGSLDLVAGDMFFTGPPWPPAPSVEDASVPASAGPDTSLTSLGLPRRTSRPAILAPDAWDDDPAPPGEAGVRSLDEVRDSFTSMQRGWERGRGLRPASDDDAAPPARWPEDRP